MVGRAPPSARHSLPGLHAGRESQRGDLENAEGRSLASPLARDEGRIEQGDRWVLPNGAEAYRQFSRKIRLLLARWQNTSITSTFVVTQIQILVCRAYRLLGWRDCGFVLVVLAAHSPIFGTSCGQNAHDVYIDN